MPDPRPMKDPRPTRTLLGLAASLVFHMIPLPVQAATIQGGDVTAVLGPTFFVDDTAPGGSDTDIAHNATASFIRLFNGLLSPNQGPTRVVLTGFGFHTHTEPTANDATTIAVTFTYLGANEAIGGGDDVNLGTATGSFVFSGGKEYIFAFDNPLAADLNITGTRFRIQVTPSNANHTGFPDTVLKLKTAALTSEPAVTGAKLSVAGIVAPVIVPGRVNLAKFQPVTASTVSGQRSAAYVTDGNAGNDHRWESANSSWNTARIDFPYPVEVGSAHVFTGIQDGPAVSNFNLQYLDGNNWITIPGASVSGNANVETNLVFTLPVTASSFRLIGQDAPLRIREIALYPPNGPAGYPLGTDVTLNLAHQRSASASSHSAGNPPLKAVDGRSHTGSFWKTTTAGTQNLDIDLQSSTKVGSIHLYSGSPGVAPLAAFTLRSWDGTAWQTIPGGTVSGNSTADLVLSFPPVTTTQIRIEFTNPGTTSIRELQVFPANSGNTGYPLGTNIVASGAIPDYDLYHDAFHQLRNPASNRFITSTPEGSTVLDQAGQTIAQGQYQVLLNLSNGTYRLRNRQSGKCLVGNKLSNTPGLPLIEEVYQALPHQDWILSPLGSGDIQWINTWSGLAIDTQASATPPGTPLVQNTDNDSATQRWEIVSSEKYPKKGIGGTLFAGPTESKWAYRWGPLQVNAMPADVSFYPMQWGDFSWDFVTSTSALWGYYPSWRSRSDGIHLMGFNEPDREDQAGASLDPLFPSSPFNVNRTIAESLRLWPRLMAMDQPLVSPVPASSTSNWFPDFFSQADSLGYRVDYTAIHLYPGPSGGSSDGLISSLQTAWNNFDRPVWLTEFSFVDWGKNQSWSEEDTYQALAEFLWRAENLPWLRKYALFVFTEDAEWPQPANPWQNVTPGPRSNTYDINGRLTAYGKLYAAWDNDATVRTDKTYYIHHKQFQKRLANNTASTNLAGRHIRTEGDLVHWRLLPAPTAGRYYITSLRDGRRVSTNGTTASFAPAGTTGTDVEWSLTEAQHGWFYLVHSTSSKKLQLSSFDNSNNFSSFTMAASTVTSDAVQWRFIVPAHVPVWTGLAGNSWSESQSWSPDKPSSSADLATFNSLSTANLSTVLDQNLQIAGIQVLNPAGHVSVGGSGALSIDASGIDLSSATRDLSLAVPVSLTAAQSWNAAAGRSLAVQGGITGASALSLAGAGTISLGGAVSPPIALTVSAGATLKTTAASVLASGATANPLTLAGTLDLAGTSQAINFITGTGTIDNSSPSPASLTLGNQDTGGTLSTVITNTGGPLTLIKTGTSTLTLPAANSHSGGFTNNGTGNILPQHASAFGSGPVVMNGGTLYSTSASLTFTNPLTLNGATLRLGGGGGKTLTWDGPVTVTGSSGILMDNNTTSITLNGAVDIASGTLSTSAGSLTHFINGPITGTAGNLTVATGILQIAGPSTFGGTTTIADGCFLRLTGNGTLPSNSNIVNNGGLTIRNTTNWVHNGTITGDNTASISLNTGTNATLAGNISGISSITADHGGTDATITGAISGSASITIQTSVNASGTGAILRLGGNNSYTGTTSIQRGRLVLAASNVLPNTSAITIGNATLDAGGFTDSTGTLDPTAAATIQLGSGSVLAFANSSAINWSGGSLAINGAFTSGSSIRFGTTSTGLTGTQLGLITVNGSTGPFILNSGGYLAFLVTPPYDLWKSVITNGLQQRTDDADADGFTNLQEFLFGTSPVAGNGSLVATTRSGGNLILSWMERTSGASYALLQTSSLLTESWSTVTSPVPSADPNQTAVPSGYIRKSVTIPISPGARFHQIRGTEN